MSSTFFRKGTAYRLDADTLNGWQEATRAARGAASGADPFGAFESPRMVFAKNSTGTLAQVGHIMCINGTGWAPVREGSGSPISVPKSNLFQNRPVLSIGEPTAALQGKACVVAEPIGAGKIGKVIVYGYAPVQMLKYREGDTRATTRAGSRVLHSGHVGEFAVVTSESGFSGDSGTGHGPPEAPLPLWAWVHLAPPPQHALTVRIGTSAVWPKPETDPAETRPYRRVYEFAEAWLDATPASGTIGTWIVKPGGINSTDFPAYRAVNLSEALHSDTTHAATEPWEPIPEGTIVRAWPELDSIGRTLFVFDEPTPQILTGRISAASASGLVTASSVTYSVKVHGRNQTITGVRPHWGTPVVETGKIIAADVGSTVILVRAPDSDNVAMTWYALIRERLDVTECA
jgi:hypothetical protein